MRRVPSAAGATLLRICDELGAITMFFAAIVRSLVPPRLDGRELLTHLHFMGIGSLPIMLVTAPFTGALMMLQSAPTIERLGATALAGWGAGYAILREVGPILIALLFSGRVGANNTATLGTMAVTEQIDGLRIVAIDPMQYLVLPRVLAMTLSLVALTIFGNAIALLGAALTSKFALGIEISTVVGSFREYLDVADATHGMLKSLVFGLIIAVTSCFFGMTATGGAPGVGRAVHRAVVVSACFILLFDFIVTRLVG